MKRLITAVSLFTALVAASIAQTDAEVASLNNSYWDKLVQIDLYNEILPVLFTKDQLNQLLPVIEKAREKVREARKTEYEERKKVMFDIDKAIADAKDKGAVPSETVRAKIADVNRRMTALETGVGEGNTLDVATALKKIVNAGQLKAAANSLDPKQFGKLKPEELTQDEKLDMFCREILLHPAAYPILINLSKKDSQK